MVWKQTMDNVVEAAWACHQQAAHKRHHQCLIDEGLFNKRAAHYPQEGAHQEAARLEAARQEAAHQEAACATQRLLDKRAALDPQEAARQEAAHAAQRLLNERVTLDRQEAAHCQCLLDDEAARCQRAAQACKTAASHVIFLWLRR